MAKSLYFMQIFSLVSFNLMRVLCRPGSFNETRNPVNASSDVNCPSAIVPTFCSRCISVRKIRDAKKCILTELSQASPDGLSYNQKDATVSTWDEGTVHFPAGQYGITTADAFFQSNGTRIQLSLNIDSCRRIDQNTRIGPMDVGKRKLQDVTMEDIVNQLFSLPGREAVALVISNAREGLKTAKAYLDSSSHQQSPFEMTLSELIEENTRNMTIKYLSNVICRAVGGTAVWASTWTSLTAFSAHTSGGQPPTLGQQVFAGATATLSLLLFNEIINYLEEVQQQPALLAGQEWIMWIFETVVSRARELLRSMPPIPTIEIDPVAFARAVWAYARGDVAIEAHQLGLRDIVVTSAQVPGQCNVPRMT